MKLLNTYYKNALCGCMWLCGCCIALSSCVMVPLEERNNEAYLMIFPDESELVLPELTYYFYNMDDQDTGPLVFQGTKNGRFEGYVPAGTYRVIATNQPVKGVVFENMNKHNAASVRALQTDGGTRADYTLLNQPGMVYSVPMGDFVVVGSEKSYYYPQPALLTKTITFSFTLDEELREQVKGLDGVLQGIYPSVYLYSQLPIPSGVENSPSMAIQFESVASGNTWSSQIYLFGVSDPDYGDDYQNLLTVTLEMNNGTTEEVKINLSGVLSDAIEENGGEIPLEVPLEIEITGTDIGARGEAKPWNDGGESGETLL